MTQPDINDFETLPDLLRPGLRLVFVGINPSVYSAERGHYFARGSNRFWPAFSWSRLSEAMRAALGRPRLVPTDDVHFLEFGIGFTDVVKVPTPKAGDLEAADFRLWTPRLIDRLEWARPAVVCFHGVTGYRALRKYGSGDGRREVQLGLQSERLGHSDVFVVPNPSGANAHYKLEDQIAWYDRLDAHLRRLGPD